MPRATAVGAAAGQSIALQQTGGAGEAKVICLPKRVVKSAAATHDENKMKTKEKFVEQGRTDKLAHVVLLCNVVAARVNGGVIEVLEPLEVANAFAQPSLQRQRNEHRTERRISDK